MSVKKCQNISRCCGEIANNADTLKKASGLAVSCMDFTSGVVECATGFSGVKTAFAAPRDLFSATGSVINASAILCRINEWSNPELRRSILHPWEVKYGWAPSKLLKGIPGFWRWQQRANKIALTAAQTLESISFIDRNSVDYFGQRALSIGGKLPIFKVIKDFFFALSAFFSCWFSSLEIQFAKKCQNIFKKRQIKWKSRLDLFKSSDEFDCDKICKKYEEKKKSCQRYPDNESKKTRYEKYLGFLNRKQVEAFQKAYAERLREKYERKCEESIKNLQEIGLDLNNATPLEISEKIKAIKDSHLILSRLEKAYLFIQAIDRNKIAKLLRHKVSLQEIRKGYTKNLIKKSWISIAASVAKIFLIVVGTTIFALSFVPQLSFLKHPAAKLTLTGFAILSGTFGLTKNLYGDIFYKEANAKITKKLEDTYQCFKDEISVAAG